MQYNGLNLCDFCFEPLGKDGKCSRCGLTKENYIAKPGLLWPGKTLNGKYIIGRLLGRGGFGATYLAYSTELQKRVAIKEYFPISMVYRGNGEEIINVISDENKELFNRGAKSFFEEAKTISKFNYNENVVTVYEFFYANGTVYYAMEYLEGMDLKNYVAAKGGKLSVKEASYIMKKVCNALVVVHSTLTLHRDISPDNIYMCSDGGIKIIDFGAAKQVVSSESQNFSVVVKQGFAPAEQYSKKGNQSAGTDIYALGATMYYVLTGEIPPIAIDRIENPNLEINVSGENAREFIAIINKCMQVKIDERYKSVVELMTDIDKMPRFTDEAAEVSTDNTIKAEKTQFEKEDVFQGYNEPINTGENVTFVTSETVNHTEAVSENINKKSTDFSVKIKEIWQLLQKKNMLISLGALALCMVIAVMVFTVFDNKDSKSQKMKGITCPECGSGYHAVHPDDEPILDAEFE